MFINTRLARSLKGVINIGNKSELIKEYKVVEHLDPELHLIDLDYR